MVDPRIEKLKRILASWIQDNYKEVVFRLHTDADKIEFSGIERISKTWAENDVWIVQTDISFRLTRKRREQTIVRTIGFKIDKNDEVIGYDCSRPDKDILLVEYQKAQDSAEHHDNLVWTTSSIILSGMLILIGFSLENLAKYPSCMLVFCVGLLGVVLTIFLLILQYSFRKIKCQKYDRCADVEQELGMEQHSKLDYGKMRQTLFYWLVLGIFILFWAFILLKNFGIEINVAGCRL